ncbi:MAG: ATP-binding protein [Paludibacter sp.]|nr:ATP-binding protein [Paludibacter sp.]
MYIPTSLISRKRYIDQITPFMDKSIIKVMTGQRRVGKSYLLFQLIQQLKETKPEANIIYINCEDIAFSDIKDADSLHKYIVSNSIKNESNYIFIDEVQDVIDFEKALRSLLLTEGNDIYITGSNANLLSGELATYLGGRYIEFPIYSLSYCEFLEFHTLVDSNESYLLFIKYGGLPYLVNLALTDEVAWDYLYSIYSTILLRDVVTRNKLRNIAFFEQLVLFLADNIGSLFSAKKISDYLKSQQVSITSVQIQNYVEYLKSAFLIHAVRRYDITGKRFFEIGEKYYFENLGLRNAVIGFKATDRAKLLENVVYNHLLYLGYKVNVGSLNVYEIDFIGERKGERIYVQVTQGIDNQKTFDREFGNLLKIQDNYPKWIITEDDFQGNSIEGIKVIPVRKFLLADKI